MVMMVTTVLGGGDDLALRADPVLCVTDGDCAWGR